MGSAPAATMKKHEGCILENKLTTDDVRKLGNFRYILIPEIINKFMTIISDPVRTEHVHVFKLNLK
jgi:hypothetical protein